MYLGVLIVTISLFLLPTIASFYYYAFISIILSVMILQLFLILLQILLTDFPYYLLVLAFWYPYLLPNRVRIEVKKHNTSQLDLVPIKSNLSSCFVQLSQEFGKILKEGSEQSLLTQIFKSILYGESLQQIMRNFLSILASSGSEDTKDVHKSISQSQFLR